MGDIRPNGNSQNATVGGDRPASRSITVNTTAGVTCVTECPPVKNDCGRGSGGQWAYMPKTCGERPMKIISGNPRWSCSAYGRARALPHPEVLQKQLDTESAQHKESAMHGQVGAEHRWQQMQKNQRKQKRPRKSHQQVCQLTIFKPENNTKPAPAITTPTIRAACQRFT